MPGENYTFTTHVDPGFAPATRAAGPKGGGGAGYCPRVRNDYSEQRLSP